MIGALLGLALTAGAVEPCVLFAASAPEGHLQVRVRAEVAAAIHRPLVAAGQRSLAQLLEVLGTACSAAVFVDEAKSRVQVATLEGAEPQLHEERLSPDLPEGTLGPRVAEALRAALLKVDRVSSADAGTVSRPEAPRTWEGEAAGEETKAGSTAVRRPEVRCRYVLVLLVCSAQTLAVDVAARVDGAILFPLSSPQADAFGPGPEVMATFELGLHRYFDVEAQVGWASLSAKGTTGSGTSLLFGLGARGKAPFSGAAMGWLEGIVHFNRSGEVNVPSVSAALGVTFRPVAALGLGPFVRFTHLLAPASAPEGYAAYSATLLSAGVSLELGNTAREPEPVVEETPPPPPPPEPAKPVETDADGDGIRGAADLCPDAPEDRDGYEDQDGCPEPDNDGDGVLDLVDACPEWKGTAATRGCPDGDGDEVADDRDECPEKKGPPSNGGCPKYKEVRVTDTKLEIAQKIFFAYGKTTVMPRSFPLLDEVTQALRDHRKLCVRVEGHTDSVGNAERNRVLSEGRAQAVRSYLETHGIDAGRLGAKGYGPSLPMESNATPEGREKNRRVEFVITSCEGVTP